jgi:hypothetical protein
MGDNMADNATKFDGPPPAAEETQSTAVQVVYEPAMKMEVAIRVFDQVTQFCKKQMAEGIDYGELFERKAGGDDTRNKPKPILFKPGAEKLQIWFGLIPEFAERTEIIPGAERPVISIDVTCTLRDRDGVVRGISIANCNSEEDKYLSQNRWLTESKIPAGIDKSKLPCEDRPGRNGGKFKVYWLAQAVNPMALLNTLKKMAQKRAFVGAVLMATGTSSIFQQQLDDEPSESEHKQENQAQSQLNARPPAESMPPTPPTEAEVDAIVKREAFHDEWASAPAKERIDKIIELGKKVHGEWKEAWGDASKFELKKQMSWLMEFAVQAGLIPANPVKK